MYCFAIHASFVKMSFLHSTRGAWYVRLILPKDSKPTVQDVDCTSLSLSLESGERAITDKDELLQNQASLYIAQRSKGCTIHVYLFSVQLGLGLGVFCT
jgi:hypothetical protein